jgi:hypothetical protein
MDVASSGGCVTRPVQKQEHDCREAGKNAQLLATYEAHTHYRGKFTRKFNEESETGKKRVKYGQRNGTLKTRHCFA